MSTISELAKGIRDAKAAAEKIAAEKKSIAVRQHLSFIYQEFAIAFSEMLPVLKASGITWEPCLQDEAYFCLQDEAYFFKGSYILFRKGDKSLKMDFSNRDSYRYEFQPYDTQGCGRSCYGKWPMDGFILFLDNGLS